MSNWRSFEIKTPSGKIVWTGRLWETREAASDSVRGFNNAFTSPDSQYWTVEVRTISGSLGFITIQRMSLHQVKYVLSLEKGRYEFIRMD